ncbi:hypothetical protein HDU83_008984 [Entophlyctis luteolus]|nr:hypothetical protein HDU83_008984 [Entophlyctis luteolus]
MRHPVPQHGALLCRNIAQEPSSSRPLGGLAEADGGRLVSSKNSFITGRAESNRRVFVTLHSQHILMALQPSRLCGGGSGGRRLGVSHLGALRDALAVLLRPRLSLPALTNLALDLHRFSHLQLCAIDLACAGLVLPPQVQAILHQLLDPLHLSHQELILYLFDLTTPSASNSRKNSSWITNACVLLKIASCGLSSVTFVAKEVFISSIIPSMSCGEEFDADLVHANVFLNTDEVSQFQVLVDAFWPREECSREYLEHGLYLTPPGSTATLNYDDERLEWWDSRVAVAVSKLFSFMNSGVDGFERDIPQFGEAQCNPIDGDDDFWCAHLNLFANWFVAVFVEGLDAPPVELQLFDDKVAFFPDVDFNYAAQGRCVFLKDRY